PLDGWICAVSLIQIAPEKSVLLQSFVEDMERLCAGRDWFTTDDLGLGGLLLQVIRLSDLDNKEPLQGEISTEKLLDNSLEGMRLYGLSFGEDRSARQRLAFRECGLSLGIRALVGLSDRVSPKIDLHEVQGFLPLAEEIEGFWRNKQNQKSPTWVDHLDINEVSLASSLLAKSHPHAFI